MKILLAFVFAGMDFWRINASKHKIHASKTKKRWQKITQMNKPENNPNEAPSHHTRAYFVSLWHCAITHVHILCPAAAARPHKNTITRTFVFCVPVENTHMYACCFVFVVGLTAVAEGHRETK
jgi:hypothetical protein